MESEKAKRKNDDNEKNEFRKLKSDVWFYLFILILIAIVVILILALTGPKIGNIFSNIVPLLEAPP